MDKIGLTYKELDEILLKSLALDKPPDVNAMRDVISTAIVKNNEKILKDIQKLLAAK